MATFLTVVLIVYNAEELGKVRIVVAIVSAFAREATRNKEWYA